MVKVCKPMGYSSHSRMSSCSVSMKWKMCFSCYTIRQNNPRTHIYFMYFLLLNLKYNICHWSKNLWSVAGRNDDTHPVCQGKNHKVTYFEKCLQYSLKIHVFLCPFFNYTLDAVCLQMPRASSFEYYKSMTAMYFSLHLQFLFYRNSCCQ